MKKKDFDSFDQLDDYFIKDKKESTKYLFEIYDLLSQKVDKYIDPSMPIIKGKKIKYNDILKNKKMPEDQQNINKVFDDFSKLFKRAVIWENAGTMINITPPVNIVSLIAAFYTAQYNPNFAQDESSGYLMTTELLVAKYLSDLVDWDYKKSGGIFTFGGKGTNLYAVKVGLKKIFPNITDEGIADRKIVVISNEKSHPCS